MSQALGTYQYDRRTWRWTTRVWTKESFTDLPYCLQIAAANEYYVALDVVSGSLSLFYLDPTLDWQAPGNRAVQLQGWNEPPLDNLAIETGAAMAVVSVVGNPRANPMNYTLFVVQWDQSYTLQIPQAFSYTDYQTRYATGWTGSVVAPGMVACAARLPRFSGTAWLQNNGLYDPSEYLNFEQRFAYGPDYAIRILAGAGTASAAVLVFDPNGDCSGWTRSALSPTQQLPVNAPITASANWPTAGQSDYMAIGQYLYFRGSSTDWSAPLAGTPIDLEALVDSVQQGYFLNTQSLINEAPASLTACIYPNSDQSAQTAVFLLKDGQLVGTAGQIPGLPTLLADQLIWVPGTGAATGVYPGDLTLSSPILPAN